MPPQEVPWDHPLIVCIIALALAQVAVITALASAAWSLRRDVHKLKGIGRDAARAADEIRGCAGRVVGEMVGSGDARAKLGQAARDLLAAVGTFPAGDAPSLAAAVAVLRQDMEAVARAVDGLAPRVEAAARGFGAGRVRGTRIEILLHPAETLEDLARDTAVVINAPPGGPAVEADHDRIDLNLARAATDAVPAPTPWSRNGRPPAAVKASPGSPPR